ncbi:ABC transporter permease [Rhodanobacter sp. AS-Z3]|uniref:ABC transporter permease n=1 Tax=Rhodanobacter sp. AS-Z3 TaxID=3031330 RepID=UPI002479C66D|nr:FtsX-like permease family protein [Rhodanobacter sp. AS-Z3]WEN13783.1 ABC transporter permease [Rhodanobacter sp. AS-Z3]
MNVYPILMALRRHKVAVLLIVSQIALTLAIVANAFFLIGHTIEHMTRPSGRQEDGLIVVLQKWTGLSDNDGAALVEKIDASQRTDLAAIRNLPDVQEVAASSQEDDAGTISLDADGKGKLVQAGYFYGDEHLRSTLGLHLVAGRDFFADEIRHGEGLPGSPIVIVSRPLANQLFPHGNALGQTVYQDSKPATIVGIVERLQTSMGEDTNWEFNAVMEPLREDGLWTAYAARARPGRTTEAMREIHKALFAVKPMRHMPQAWAGVHRFSEKRARGFSEERGIAVLIGVICVILLSVTAAGIVGLTSFWVTQRHRQIGVRRALGARKIDILRYFQIEILLIAGAGAIIGALGAVGLNTWLMRRYEMLHLPLFYVAIGALVMLVLGQVAVLVPARRASNVPPVVATRSV